MSENIYLPHLMRIAAITEEAPGVKTFRLEFVDEAAGKAFAFRTGQFGLYSAFGEGESTFCIASSPTRTGFIECTFREAGRVTSALANKDTDLIREDGSTLKLPKGTALLLVAPGGEESALAEVNLKGRKVRGTVYLLDVDLMTKPWYRISLRNGKEGWIYGEFVKAR